MPESALVYRAFDSEIFGRPFYRLEAPEDPDLPARLAALAEAGPHAVDAKLLAHERKAIARLESFGFRQVCDQITLTHDLEGLPAARSEAKVRLLDTLDLDETDLQAHAAGFRQARFMKDPRLPEAASRRLMDAWIRNSLGGRCRIAAIRADFCSFLTSGEDHVIDLLSCLERRQGHASALLRAVILQARAASAHCLKVTTEAGNAVALRVYEAAGFQPAEHRVALHLVFDGRDRRQATPGSSRK